MEAVAADRDDFPLRVKEVLAARVGHCCSNCFASTSGPQVDPEGVLNIGVAAHITAASGGGPRYNPLLSTKQRRSVANGIWLCQNCAKLVDNDIQKFTETILRERKTLAEQRALDQIGVTDVLEVRRIHAALHSLLWNVPYPHNLYFTGRERVLEEIHLRLNQPPGKGGVQAMTGLGGIGKTQTAVEFAYRYGNEYDAVLWVGADTPDQAHGDLISIARLLDLAEKEARDPQVAIAAVTRWLENTSRWLLIVDNADNPALVRPLLPARPLGHILVTSRITNLDSIGVRDPILLDVMDPATAAEFIVARTGSDQEDPGESEAASVLARELGYLPLALEQAGAYIAETGCLVQEYVKAFRERRLQLLRQSVPATGGYSKTVHSTWSLNFQEVERASPASADVLRLAAFLAPDFIPETLLIDGASELGPGISTMLATAGVDPLVINDLLRPLLRYALVIRDKASRSISIHRLVQGVIKDDLPELEQREWVLKAVRALNKVFPEASYDQWPLCDRLLPHAKVAAEYAARFGLAYDDVGFLLNEAAAFMRLRADFEGSLRTHGQSLAIRERDLPADHPAIAESLNDTACLFMDLYRYEQAEPLFRRAIEIAKRALSKDDPQYMLHLNNLGRLYVEMGRCKSATPLLKQALEIAERTPEEHLYIYAVVLNNMAELHLKLGQLPEADDACTLSLRMREGIGNPEKLARSFVTLGEIRRREGDPASAEDWFTRALDLKSEVHGADHPDLIPLLKRYARLLYGQGRSQEAIELEIRAQQIESRFDLPQYSEAECNEIDSP